MNDNILCSFKFFYLSFTLNWDLKWNSCVWERTRWQWRYTHLFLIYKMPIPGSAAPSCVMQGSPERGRALSTPTASYSSGAWMCHKTELNGIKIGRSRGVEEISVQWHELPTATDAVVASWLAPWHGEGPGLTSPCWWPGNATHSCPPVLVVNHLLLTPAKKDL